MTKTDDQEQDFIKLAEEKRWENVLREVKKNKTLKRVELFDMEGRALQRIPRINFMPMIRKLWLGSNSIKRITNLDKFPKLEYLNLRTNHLTKIENLESLVCLQDLELQNNKIGKIENLSGLKSLRYVNIGNNPATKEQKDGLIIQEDGEIERLKKNKVRYCLLTYS